MSNHQQTHMGDTDAQQHFLSNQVELFLFDLKNEAIEQGFKSGESWTLKLATGDEIIAFKKHHHLVISLKLQPYALLKVYQQVKSKLQQSLGKDDAALTVSDLARDEKTHLVAYPDRNIHN